ncbi:MAG TPA: copper-binding protein [Polyangiaceae bacterium]
MKSSVAFVAICVTLACGRSTHAAPLTTAATIDASVEAKRYASRGVLENIDGARKRVSIAHEDIPGFMNAMTMPFDVKDANLLTGLAVGDTVTFSFTVDDSDRIVLDRIEKAR